MKQYRAIIWLLGIWLALISPLTYVSAQSGGTAESIGWSPSIPLIEKGDLEGHIPQVAVDRQGRVHVFWCSWIGAEEDRPLPEALNTIFYRRLENGVWTTSNDVLVTPEGGALLIGSVAVDDQDHLNVLWFDLGHTRSLFHSRAHTSLADQPPSWETKTLDMPQMATIAPDLVTETGGRFYTVYAVDNRAILFLTSNDYGESWSSPVAIAAVSNSQSESFTNPRIAVDGKGFLHVVWSEYVQWRNWQGETLYYARSEDQGITWEVREIYRSTAEQSTAAWINIVVRNKHEIHLAWNRGIGSLQGRYHTWSNDNGQTWTDPISFFPPNESGQTHWPWMVVDSAGVIHLISKTGDGSPKYMYWDNASWSSMYAFQETQNDLDSALAIGLGNQLHFVHAAATGSGILVYNTRQTGAPPVPPEYIPAPSMSVTRDTPNPSPLPTATLTPIYVDPISANDSHAMESTAVKPLFSAILTSFGFLIFVIWISARKGRR